MPNYNVGGLKLDSEMQKTMEKRKAKKKKKKDEDKEASKRDSKVEEAKRIFEIPTPKAKINRYTLE